MRLNEKVIWRLLAALPVSIVFLLSAMFAVANTTCSELSVLLIWCVMAIGLYRLLCVPILGRWGIAGYLGCWLILLGILSPGLLRLYNGGRCF